jgi:hypothetical protein
LTTRYVPNPPLASHVCFGSNADMAIMRRDVRFTPKSGHRLRLSGCPLSANSGLMHGSKTASNRTEFCAFARTSSQRSKLPAGPRFAVGAVP